MKKKSKVAKANVSINLEKGTQINGAVETQNNVFKYLKNRDFPYKVNTLAEYKIQLEKMNLSDLQRHAVEVAHILPNVTDRNRLVQKLENEFLHKQADQMTRYNPAALPTSNITSEQAENIRKVLNRE